MTDDTLSFGRRASLFCHPSAFLALERAAGLTGRFDALDELVADIVRRVLSGIRTVDVPRDRTDSLKVLGLGQEQRAMVDDWFALQHQQSRGAWFLPEAVTLRAGLLNLPFYFKDYPRFATGLALDERAEVPLAERADALLIWALLQPLVERLFVPFELRGPQTGLKSHDEQLAAWGGVDELLATLGVDVSRELAVFRYGGGWNHLRTDERVAAKHRLLMALSQQVDHMAARRYRAAVLQTLIRQYYNKAKRSLPTRRQVLSNRPLQQAAAAYFGGDWLAFLSYIGEQPHPAERIATALPEPHLQVGGAARADMVAAEMGLPVAEVERMLAAYWGQPISASPLEARTEVLRRYWQQFDDLHARQAPGMRPLWGLVQDAGFTLADDNFEMIPYQAGLYTALLPADLLAAIERLWGTTMLPRWPERIVSEQTPHLAFAETFGPALKFWHGCALTTWFICEGPYSRTDLPGMAQYYRDELTQLADLGCPVDPSLFSDLVGAMQKLGPPTPIADRTSTAEVASRITLTVQSLHGEHRGGFERLRDTVTSHRRAWANNSLERYIRARWAIELRAAVREYNRLLEDKGRVPTTKQFAGRVVVTINHWFGGDMAALYAAVGEKALLQPERAALMPADREAFAWSVFRAIGGTPFQRKAVVATVQEGDEQNERWRIYSSQKRLAELSLSYVQLKEALGRPPTLKEFGQNKFQWIAPVLAANIDEAWKRYRDAIDDLLQNGALTRTPTPLSANNG